MHRKSNFFSSLKAFNPIRRGLQASCCEEDEGWRQLLPYIGFQVGLLLLVGLIWWLRQRQREVPVEQTVLEKAEPWPPVAKPSPAPEKAKPAAEAVAKPKAEAQAKPAASRARPAKADDLRRIEGIGPKIADLLQESGIRTYAQLAQTDTSQLKQLLKEARLYFAKPNTWPQQAKLAAAGDWEKLEKLQAELKGGQRS